VRYRKSERLTLSDIFNGGVPRPANIWLGRKSLEEKWGQKGGGDP